MSKVKIVFSLIIFLNFSNTLHAQYERPGSSGGQFLGIGVSPRALGMGSAFISVAEGAEATYYNPAATIKVQKMDFAVTHTKWFANINHAFAAGVYNLGRMGAVGVLMTGLLTDEMEVRTPLQPDGTGETFYSGNYRFGVTYAYAMTDHVSFGGSLNYIYSSLYDNFTAHAVSTDIAVLFTTNYRNFNFALKFENFGSELKFINEAYPLPTNFQFGLSMNAVEANDHTLLMSISAKKHNEGRPVGQLGAEWNFRKKLFLRGGYQLNSDIETYAFGAGFNMKLSNYLIRLDYSYSDFSLLGASHRFGMGFAF